jgi:hypothetical protein
MQTRAGKSVTKRRVAQRYWRITGQKKFETFFEVTIPLGSITDERLKDLLRCLNARANNSPFAEIVGAYVKKRTRGAHDFLEPRSNCPQFGYSCGYDDAQFVAIIVDEKGDRVAPPPLAWT